MILISARFSGPYFFAHFRRFDTFVLLQSQDLTLLSFPKRHMKYKIQISGGEVLSPKTIPNAEALAPKYRRK